jgi:hypothetical protein
LFGLSWVRTCPGTDPDHVQARARPLARPLAGPGPSLAPPGLLSGSGRARACRLAMSGPSAGPKRILPGPWQLGVTSPWHICLLHSCEESICHRLFAVLRMVRAMTKPITERTFAQYTRKLRISGGPLGPPPPLTDPTWTSQTPPVLGSLCSLSPPWGQTSA